MKNTFILFSIFIFSIFISQNLDAQVLADNLEQKNSGFEIQNVICFNPEIEPQNRGNKKVTYDHFFSAVSNRFSHFQNNKMLRVDTPISFENVDIKIIQEICKNNNAVYAVVPKVKFFKVGIGQFVFSSQVVVSMKLYDAEGNFISGSSYDTFRKNARILGSAENSIKIGTNGALKSIVKDLRKLKNS